MADMMTDPVTSPRSQRCTTRAPVNPNACSASATRFQLMRAGLSRPGHEYVSGRSLKDACTPARPRVFANHVFAVR